MEFRESRIPGYLSTRQVVQWIASNTKFECFLKMNKMVQSVSMFNAFEKSLFCLLNDHFEARMSSMTKYELVEKIKGLLKTDIDLNFLLSLKKEEIERLVACIRERVDQVCR